MEDPRSFFTCSLNTGFIKFITLLEAGHVITRKWHAILYDYLDMMIRANFVLTTSEH